MSKSIKISDKVYNKLEGFRNKRETFSEAVERLLLLSGRIGEMINIVEGQISYQEKHIAELEKEKASHR